MAELVAMHDQESAEKHLYVRTRTLGHDTSGKLVKIRNCPDKMLTVRKPHARLVSGVSLKTEFRDLIAMLRAMETDRTKVT